MFMGQDQGSANAQGRSLTAMRPCFVRLESYPQQQGQGRAVLANGHGHAGHDGDDDDEEGPEVKVKKEQTRRGRSRSMSRCPSRSSVRDRSVGARSTRSSSVGPPSLGALGGTPRIRLLKAVEVVIVRCVLCLKPFEQHTSLLMHIKEHQRNSPTKCLVCGHESPHLSATVTHMLDHGVPSVPGEVVEPVCGLCGRRVRRVSDLAAHVMTHTGERPFRCATCGSAFCSRPYLAKHALRVHGSRDAAQRRAAALVKTLHRRCNKCYRKFGSGAELEAHVQRQHGADASAACRCFYCTKELASPSELGRHVKAAHGRERPHACLHCPKRFKSRRDRRRHETTHTKAFQCPVCNVRFSSCDECKKHASRAHKA